jgi:arabinan endo-1,5-alpha-L-arabinosidase
VPLSLSATPLAEAVAAGEVAGSWKLVDHGKDISATVKASSVLTLAAGGAASGGFSGQWRHDGNNLMTLTAGDGTVYQGVLSRQWNPNTKTFVVCFSAQSAAGVSLWGIRTGAAA